MFGNTYFPVQNVTAEEGEEEIPPPTEDLLGELDDLFPEEFINLGTMTTESNMNSLNTDPTTDHLASEDNQGNIGISEHSAEIDATVVLNEILGRHTSIPEGFFENIVSGVSVNDLSHEALETSFSSETRFEPSVPSRDDYTSSVVQLRFDSTSGMVPEMSQFLQGSAVDFLASERNQGNIGISEHSPENDCNVMLNENPESATSLPEGFVENTVCGVSVSDLSLAALGTSFSSETRFEPSVLSRDDSTSVLSRNDSNNTVVVLSSDSPNGVVPEMPQSLPESPVGTNVKPNMSRKRPLEEDSSPVSAEGIVPASKKKKGQSCSSTGEETPRVRGPSKKVRLLDQEKELKKENEELKAEVEELSAHIKFHKNYITSKLGGQCYFCKNSLPRERPTSIPEGLVENIVSGVSTNDLSREARKGQSCSCMCTGDETPRVRGPSKKEQERVLNLKVKKLEKENEEWKAEEQERLASIEVLREYIVSMLKVQCTFCKK